MAVLVIVGEEDELGGYVVDRLISQGDEVRVLQAIPEQRDMWMRRGAFLAVGAADDPDLLERAAQNVRTIVVLGERVTESVIATALEAGPKAGVDRLVCCAPSIPAEVAAIVSSSSLSHVLLESGRPGLLRRKVAPPRLVAEAIDAADDLAGEPHMTVDLTNPEQVGRLLF